MEVKGETYSETPVPWVFELPGEPAVVINGVPDIPVTDGTLVDGNRSQKHSNGVETSRSTGFGEWLEGREVQKLFGKQYYTGVVTEFDKESGWYRVVYEDGDFEDLEWHELQDILKPLDITIPLRTLALKIIRKSDKSDSVKNGAGERKRGGRPRGSSTRSSTRS